MKYLKTFEHHKSSDTDIMLELQSFLSKHFKIKYPDLKLYFHMKGKYPDNFIDTEYNKVSLTITTGNDCFKLAGWANNDDITQKASGETIVFKNALKEIESMEFEFDNVLSIAHKLEELFGLI